MQNKHDGRTYVSNAFSLQMIEPVPTTNIKIDRISETLFRGLIKNAYSIVGHPDMAKILNVKYNRESITLHTGDTLLVAQITGGRLPPGTTILPEDVDITYLHVTITE